MENQNTSIWIIKNEMEMNDFITNALNNALKLDYTHRLIEGVERVDSIKNSEGDSLHVKWRKLETIEQYGATKAGRLEGYLLKIVADLGQEFDSVVIATGTMVLDASNNKKVAFNIVGQEVTKDFLDSVVQEIKTVM